MLIVYEFGRVEFIELNAKLNPLNLGQGFPDFMPAEKVVKELAKTCDQEANALLHQYTRSMVWKCGLYGE